MDGHSALRYSPGVIELPPGTVAPLPDGTLVRIDRAVLRPHRDQADGARRYDAILSIAEKPLQYAWGVEVVTAEALSDPAYLETLRGLALTRRHPRSGRVDVAAREQGDGRVVGVVLGARYDETDRCVVLEILVQDPGTITDIEEGRLSELSEGYDVVELAARPDGVGEQRRRAPNHVALVENGRMPGAIIRTDEEDPMEEEEDTAEVSRMDALEKRMDAYEARMDAAEKRLPAEFAAAAASEGDRADADDEARIEGEITARDLLRRRADALGMRLPVEAKSSTQIRRALARAILGESAQDLARCDSTDYADGVIRAAPMPTTAKAVTTSNSTPV